MVRKRPVLAFPALMHGLSPFDVWCDTCQRAAGSRVSGMRYACGDVLNSLCMTRVSWYGRDFLSLETPSRCSKCHQILQSADGALLPSTAKNRGVLWPQWTHLSREHPPVGVWPCTRHALAPSGHGQHCRYTLFLATLGEILIDHTFCCCTLF